MSDVVERAEAALEGIAPGQWYWGGNTDHGGDVGLYGYMPGMGVVDVLRTCQERRDPETIGAEWDTGDLSDYISREDYISERLDHPRR